MATNMVCRLGHVWRKAGSWYRHGKVVGQHQTCARCGKGRTLFGI